MAKNSGKSLKIKARLEFLGIKSEASSTQERIAEIRKITGNYPWPVYLAGQGKKKEFHTFWKKYRAKNRTAQISANSKRLEERRISAAERKALNREQQEKIKCIRAERRAEKLRKANRKKEIMEEAVQKMKVEGIISVPSRQPSRSAKKLAA